MVGSSFKQFFGVIVSQGFITFQLLDIEGVLGDQKQMWTADFTFAGTAVLIGDANGDLVVSANDYASVQSNFGTTAGMGGDLIAT